ncbi:hypothetical protein [Sulfuricurvum sp.]|uniref:hypothetical protein n=1 Tax=Sulfuricurvum sp. TaxID=2025608 RepID=UPI003C67A6A2
MRRFRRFFVILFVASTLLGALHEVIHHHDMDSHIQESCPLYLLTQTTVLPIETYQLQKIVLVYEPFSPPELSNTLQSDISLRSRSPPLS